VSSIELTLEQRLEESLLVLLACFERDFDDFVAFEWVKPLAGKVLVVKHLKTAVLLFDLEGYLGDFWEQLGRDSIEHFHWHV